MSAADEGSKLSTAALFVIILVAVAVIGFTLLIANKRRNRVARMGQEAKNEVKGGIDSTVLHVPFS